MVETRVLRMRLIARHDHCAARERYRLVDSA